MHAILILLAWAALTLAVANILCRHLRKARERDTYDPWGK